MSATNPDRAQPKKLKSVHELEAPLKKYTKMMLFPDPYKIIEGAQNRIVIEEKDYGRVMDVLKTHGLYDFAKAHSFHDISIKRYHLGLPNISDGKIQKKFPSDMSIDDVIYVFQGEYAITSAKDARPLLSTNKVGDGYCRALLIYEPRLKIGSLSHIDYIQEFGNVWDDVLGKIDTFGGTQYKIWMSPIEENADISIMSLKKLIELKEESLKSQNKLLSIDELPLKEFVFDTDDGQFYDFVPSLATTVNKEREDRLLSRLKSTKGDSDKKLHCIYEPTVAQ